LWRNDRVPVLTLLLLHLPGARPEALLLHRDPKSKNGYECSRYQQNTFFGVLCALLCALNVTVALQSNCLLGTPMLEGGTVSKLLDHDY
jgi:hypothetical protein